MDITLPAYVWRGKTYKTTSGLCRAVDKAHGGACSVSFDREHMYVCNRKAAS